MLFIFNSNLDDMQRTIENIFRENLNLSNLMTRKCPLFTFLFL